MKAKGVLVILLLMAGFVVGAALEFSTRRQLERDLSTARQQSASYQASSQLWQLRDVGALLGLEAARSNYAAASEHSTRFFDLVRAVVPECTDANLKGALQEILTSRDRITSGLAKKDPAVLPEIQILVAKVHEGANR